METKPEQNHNIHIRTVKTAKTIVAFFFLIAALDFVKKYILSSFTQSFTFTKLSAIYFSIFTLALFEAF